MASEILLSESAIPLITQPEVSLTRMNQLGACIPHQLSFDPNRLSSMSAISSK